jgi:hypothetical protein
MKYAKQTDTLTDGWWLCRTPGRRVARPFGTTALFTNAHNKVMTESKVPEEVVGHTASPTAVVDWLANGDVP